MRVTGDETPTMSRSSFLMKKYNYSHCPLKKRPVIQFFKEDTFQHDKDISDDNSEPENLSTKPEDLSMTCKSLTPPPGVVLITNKKPATVENDIQNVVKRSHSPAHFAPSEGSYGQHFLSKSSGGPLEPLNLNASVNHHHESPTPTWPRAVPAHYPHIPLIYHHYPPLPSEELYPHYYPSVSPPRISHEPLSPYAPHELPPSPPHHGAFTPFRSHVPVIAALPHCPPSTDSRTYIPYSQTSDSVCTSPLSPTSSSSSNSYPYTSPPPVSPEDLSSSGSVTSNADINGNSKKKSKDNSAPRYKCAFCSKSYSTYSGLSKHQQFHCSANEDSTAKKTFSCKYCEKVYVSLGALKMHIRTHTLPCKCKLCGKAFSRPWLLQGHIRTHTGEKPFSCPHCNRAFADRSNLRAHLQTHSDVKKYCCSNCNKTFSRMSLLSKHSDGGCPGSATGVIRINEDAQRQTFYQSC